VTGLRRVMMPMLGMPPLGMLLLRGVALLTAVSVTATAQVVDVGAVRIQLCTPEIVRVLAAGSSAVEAVGNKSSLVVVNEWPEEVAHTVAKDADGATEIKTEALKIVVATDGNVSFFSMDSGAPLLAELGREFGDGSVTQTWDSPPTESLFGLGHFNFGLMDFRLAPVDMTQWNLWKIVPFLVSTRGWGVLWDTSYATAGLNKVTDAESVPLGAWSVRPVEASDPAPTRAYNSTPTNWSETSGSITVTEAGTHWVYMKIWQNLIWCSHGARVKIGSEIVIDLFDDPCNLPPSTLGRIHLEPGTHTVTVQTWAQNPFEPNVWVRAPGRYGNKTSWQSDRPASSVDYYFMGAENPLFRAIFILKRSIHPRQAWDKHRKR
jgi:alpha-D-xyloside xylohydrolase